MTWVTSRDVPINPFHPLKSKFVAIQQSNAEANTVRIH